MRRVILIIAMTLMSKSISFAGLKCESSVWTNCNGVKVLSNGDKYVGEFRENKYNGKGTYVSANGEVYVGNFKNGQRHGYGKYTYNDGSIYTGDFVDGKPHGKGRYTWKNGDLFVGEYKWGLRNGSGVFTKNSSFLSFFGIKSKKGIWIDDKFKLFLKE